MTVDTHGARKPRRRFGAPKNWRTTFLGALAETSNVKASAELADISQSWVYKTRREDQEFARQWLEALCEGYDNLEMDLVHRLRNGEIRDADGRKFDNAAAIRLLALHKADVARARALRDDLTEQAVLASIDAMLDAMRERTAANTGDDAIGPDDDGA